MARGRDSGPAMAMVLLLVLPFLAHPAAGVMQTEYTVGDAKGWSFGISGWEKGKNFTAGDVLIFKYWKLIHNVVNVDFEGYKNCQVSKNATEFTSGNDRILLEEGDNFFICTTIFHCLLGMKISAHAAPLPS